MLCAELWPSFDGSELEVLERRILDEAAELFGTHEWPCPRLFVCHIRAVVFYVLYEHTNFASGERRGRFVV